MLEVMQVAVEALDAPVKEEHLVGRVAGKEKWPSIASVSPMRTRPSRKSRYPGFTPKRPGVVMQGALGRVRTCGDPLNRLGFTHATGATSDISQGKLGVAYFRRMQTHTWHEAGFM